MRIAVILLAVPILLLLAAGGLYLASPPKSLDVLDYIVPGERGVRRVASGEPFMAGPRGRLDIWAPVQAGPPRPVLIFYYGGGWAMGRRQDYGFVARAYAAHGFVVVLPDYRLVPEVRFPVFLQDAAAAVRWTHDNIARYGGEPGRIVLGGHSAGAYLSIMLALDPSYLQAAGIDGQVVRAAAGLAGPYDFYPFDQKRSIDAMSLAPDPKATQPITFARADAPPLWLAAGTGDTLVRPRNSIILAERQRALGSKTTQLRLYPGLSHNDLIMAVSQPFRRKAPVLEDSIAFYRSVLGPN